MEVRPSWVFMEDPGWPLPCVTLPGCLALRGGTFQRDPTLGVAARFEEWRQLLHALPPNPAESLMKITARAICIG